MSTQEQISEEYAAQRAAQQDSPTPPAGRWIVQKWDEPKGVYRDELRTQSAVLAEHGFRQGQEYRVLDSKLNDVAADYPRTAYNQARGEAEYSPRSPFSAALANERVSMAQTDLQFANPQAALTDGVRRLNASEAFLQAATPDDRRAASEKHPHLAQAFALEANYAKLSQGIQGEGAQIAFLERMRENIASDVAKGRPLVDVHVRDAVAVPEVRHQVDQDRNR